MIKVFEDFYDKFTSKEYKFEVNQENSNEVIEMIYQLGDNTKLLKQGDYTKELTIKLYLNRDILSNEVLYYGIEVNLTDKEWNKLLTECEEHNYQLIIKKNHDQMCFTKIESK